MTIKFFNNPPYYDDFDETKNYLRILFRPGAAVQARELTQMQTALQAQIDRHGRHIFKEGSPVLGGNMSLDNALDFVKLESSFTPSNGGSQLVTDNYWDELIGTVVTGQTTGVTATVIDALPSEDTANPITIYVKYLNSGTDSVTKTFEAGEELISDGVNLRRVKAKGNDASPIGKGTRFSIEEGVFFVNGNFVYSGAGSMILSRYETNPSVRIAYQIHESIVTSAEDATISDNALGTPNEAAPGAHRYQILLDLISQPFDFTEVRLDNIIQLMVIEEGRIKQKARTEYSELADTLAQRTYEESGNYTVQPFLLNMREHLNDGTNNGLYTLNQIKSKYDIATDNAAQVYGERRLAIGLEKSVAYVNGYRIELADIKYIDLLKSRESDYFNGAAIVAPLGNYVYVDVNASLPDVDNFTIINLRNASSTTIGTARVRSIEKVSGTLHKLYLFDVSMYSNQVFSSVRTLYQTLVSGAAFQATVNSTYGYRVYEANVNSLVFQLPFSTVKTLLLNDINDTFYTVKKSYLNNTVTASTTSITITDGIFQSFNAADWLATDVSSGAAVSISGVTLSYNVATQSSTATITFNSFTSGNVNIIAPVEKNLSRKTKTLISDYVGTRNTPNTTSGGYDPLGVSDVLRLNYVKDKGVPLAGGDYLDITDRYELDNGQRDNFYDLARIRLKPGFNPPLGQIEFSVDHFQHSSGDYFSVDSYSGIDYKDIPSFQSAQGAIRLADAIDFRPTKDVTGNNFTGSGSSTVDMIKPGSVIKADIVYYLNRIDKVYVDKYGNFGIIEGVPALKPESPRDPQDAMVLYELFVSSYTFGPESIRPRMIDNKRYTMRDIGRLESRIKNLEYYTSLSLLEKETSDYQLPSGSFKNGFIVDSFRGHNVGNPAHPDYSCSTDKANGILRPQFVEDSIRLIWNSANSTGLRQTGPLLTLDYTEKAYIEQPYASYSEFVNPYNVFTWSGDMKLSPESDNWKDTETRPDVIVDQEGVYDSFKQLADAAGVTGTQWNEWQTNWSGVIASASSATRQTVRGGDFGGWGIGTLTTTTTINTIATGQSRSGIRTDVVPDTVTTNMGDRVVEVNFVPYIRSRIVSFKAERLKPNTKLYAFFDGKDITDYCTTTAQFFTFNDFTTANSQYTSSFTFNGRTSWPEEVVSKTDLVTDASGAISGFFIVPNNVALKFKTGQRVFRLCDSQDNLTASTTTFAEAIYEAAGLIESKENVILSTRVPRIDRTAVEPETRVIISTDTNIQRTAGGWYDPLAQTIMIDEPGGIFATSLDLYFADYDENIPVSVHLVPTLVGLPTQTIIPFTKVIKKLTAANVSEDASVATRFTFEAPVHLQQGVEYAIVIMSMSDKPKCFVSQMGGYDLTNPTYRISKQPYAGVFFKSQNASTWTPEQDKDLKFRLNRANFTTTTGKVAFRNVEIQPTQLTVDPIYTTASSNSIKVYHKNHGLFANSYANLSGVVGNSTTFLNGIPVSEINGVKLIARVERDAFWITSTTNATSTGRAGGISVVSVGNKLMNVMQASIQQLLIPGTNIDWNAKTSSGTSLPGAEQAYVRSSFFPIIPNENTYFSRLQCVPSTFNQTGGVPGFDLEGNLQTSTSFLSPVIDLDRVSLVTIANLIDNPTAYTGVDGANYIEGFVPETSGKNASGDCKYITRRIQIAGEAANIRVIMSVNRPSTTDIKLYWKVSAADDSNFDDMPWTLQAPDTPIPYDENQSSYTEVEYSIDDELNGVEFTSMAFKIVLTSQNSSFIPTVKDFRAIAFY